MTRPRKLGGICILTGLLLLSVYLVPTVYGAAMSRLAVAQFRAQSSANRQWNSSRIRAYENSLAVKFPPPEAILQIPRLGLEVPVLEGVDELTLNRAAGHIPGTARPGERGNIGITGHRDGFFRILKEVAPGDTIELKHPTLADRAHTDRYVVRSLRVVDKADVTPLGKTSADKLTLVTCYPFHFIGAAPQRYIVEASLVPPSSVQTQ